ncbi:MFS transporter [Longispora albida]|uniref:MFS transporter n=1 Tax=Longispora albida TaxID=203523 RepID=UPI00036FC51C|nr:MFS transporter [Longispora albida]
MSIIEESAEAVAPKKPVPLGRNRDFMLLWTGAGVSHFGSRMSAIAYTLVVYWSTGSKTLTGLVTFAALLPYLVTQLPAGAFVDRWDRRKVMIFCDLGRIAAIGVAAVTVFLGHVWVPLLMVVAFLEASMTVFYMLAERAAVFTVVDGSQIGGAMARNEARGQAAGLLGQPAGTLLYSVTKWLPFGTTAIAHLISLVTLLFVRADLKVQRRNVKPDIVGEVRDGFKFVWSKLYLRRALLLISLSNILFQVLSLGLIVIVKDNGGSPSTIGFILIINGLGGMVGALTSNFFMSRFSIRYIFIGVNILWAVLMPAIAFATHPIALAAIYSVIIYGAGVSNVAGIVYTMKITPGEMQGRVGSIATLLASGANSLGALAAGLILAAFVTKTAILLVGAAMTCIAILAILGFSGKKAKEADIPLT